MIEQVSVTVRFFFVFLASKVGKTGLTPNATIMRGSTVVVDAQACTELNSTKMPGVYYYDLAGASTGTEGDYVARANTSDSTVDAKDVFAAWYIGHAGIENLDATIASRLASASYTTPPTVGQIATEVWSSATRTLTSFGTLASDVWAVATRTLTGISTAIFGGVWDVNRTGHTTAGTFGESLANAGAASDPLTNEVPGSYAAGTAGQRLGMIGDGRIAVVSPVSAVGNITLKRGDSYLHADGYGLEFTETSSAVWPTLTGLTVTFAMGQKNAGAPFFTKAMTVVTATGSNKKIRLELTSAQVRTFNTGDQAYAFDMYVILGSGEKRTLVEGYVTVKHDFGAA